MLLTAPAAHASPPPPTPDASAHLAATITQAQAAVRREKRRIEAMKAAVAETERELAEAAREEAAKGPRAPSAYSIRAQLVLGNTPEAVRANQLAHDAPRLEIDDVPRRLREYDVAISLMEARRRQPATAAQREALDAWLVAWRGARDGLARVVALDPAGSDDGVLWYESPHREFAGWLPIGSAMMLPFVDRYPEAPGPPIVAHAELLKGARGANPATAPVALGLITAGAFSALVDRAGVAAP